MHIHEIEKVCDYCGMNCLEILLTVRLGKYLVGRHTSRDPVVKYPKLHRIACPLPD